MRRATALVLASLGLAIVMPTSAGAAVGDIYVADFGSSGGPDRDGMIIKVNPVSGTASVLSSGGSLVNPTGVAVAADGSLVVSDNGGGNPACGGDGCGQLLRVNPSSGVQGLISDLGDTTQNGCEPPTTGFFVNPTGVAVASDGFIYVTDAAGCFVSPTLRGSVVRVNANTGAQSLVTKHGSLQVPFGVEVSKDGGSLVVADTARQTAIDEVTGEITTLGTPGKVVRVRLPGGAQSILAEGSQLTDPTDVAIAERVTVKKKKCKKNKGKKKCKTKKKVRKQEVVFFSDRAAFDHFSAIFLATPPNLNPVSFFTGEPLSSANGVALNRGGTLMVEVNESLAAPAVNEITLRTGSSRTLAAGLPLRRPFGVTVDRGTIVPPRVRPPGSLPPILQKGASNSLSPISVDVSPLRIRSLTLPGLVAGTKLTMACLVACRGRADRARAGTNGKAFFSFPGSLRVGFPNSKVRITAFKKGLIGRYKDFRVRLDGSRFILDGFRSRCLLPGRFVVRGNLSGCGKVTRKKPKPKK